MRVGFGFGFIKYQVLGENQQFYQTIVSDNKPSSVALHQTHAVNELNLVYLIIERHV